MRFFPRKDTIKIGGLERTRDYRKMVDWNAGVNLALEPAFAVDADGFTVTTTTIHWVPEATI